MVDAHELHLMILRESEYGMFTSAPPTNCAVPDEVNRKREEPCRPMADSDKTLV
jgi:hypothetical protein